MALGANQICYFKICGRCKKATHLLKNKMLRRKPNCQEDAIDIQHSMPLVEKGSLNAAYLYQLTQDQRLQLSKRYFLSHRENIAQK